MQRRQFIAAGSSLLLASFLPLRAFANPQPRPAFAATTLDEALHLTRQPLQPSPPIPAGFRLPRRQGRKPAKPVRGTK